MRSVVNNTLALMFAAIAVAIWLFTSGLHASGELPSNLYYIMLGIPIVTAVVIVIIERVQSAREN